MISDSAIRSSRAPFLMISASPASSTSSARSKMSLRMTRKKIPIITTGTMTNGNGGHCPEAV
jgi:hypothetical protein